MGLGLVALDQLHGLINQAGEGDTDTGPGAGGDNAELDKRDVTLGSCLKEWTSRGKVSADVARLLLPRCGLDDISVGGAMKTVSRVVGGEVAASPVCQWVVSVRSVFSVLSK
mmetsp:Transcript_88925/g.176909  ORF Transcript_88925/g.176909 Transcript_88925/m.176909 type:complete len:112 (-) Transcript_88925:888-1223(-)